MTNNYDPPVVPDVVTSWLNRIKNFPVLSKEQEIELI